MNHLTPDGDINTDVNFLSFILDISIEPKYAIRTTWMSRVISVISHAFPPQKVGFLDPYVSEVKAESRQEGGLQ